jgi:hypothetical protein
VFTVGKNVLTLNLPVITQLALNNVFPPTWDGTPIGSGDVGDVGTQLRYMEGHDKYNYFTDQRREGDLFKRDLAIDAQLQALINFLSTRSGMVLSTPGTALPANSYMSLGKISNPGDKVTGGWAVYATVDDVSFSGTETSNKIKLEVIPVDGSDTVIDAAVFSVNGNSVEAAKWGATLTTDRGPFIDLVNEIYDVRVSNTSSFDALFSARLVWNNTST